MLYGTYDSQDMNEAPVGWTVLLEPHFEVEFDALDEGVQNALAIRVELLAEFGPTLGRPAVDTLNGSAYPNMKELRFQADDGIWRVAFAFDPQRRAVLLVAGDKVGTKSARFYRELLRKADDRYRDHLTRLTDGDRS